MSVRKLFLFLTIITSLVVQAAKMMPGVTTVRQADGTTLEVKAFGDEHFSYYTTTDGVLLVLEGTDFFVAEVADDGNLLSTGVLAHNALLRRADEKLLVERQNKELFHRLLPLGVAASPLRELIKDDGTLFPSKGSPKALVILAEFSDTLFHIPNTKATFDKYLNKEELFDKDGDDADMYLNYGSVKRYFKDMSFGQYTPQFDLCGPVRLDKSSKHYGAGSSSSERYLELLADACAAVDSEVDFSQYDANNDGYIDLVIVVYAGYSAAISGNSSDCIHPKSGVAYSSKTFDGKSICRFALNSELFYNPQWFATRDYCINGIGVFCHEFAHCLGLPDLYPTPGTQAYYTIDHNLDYWSLMDAGEYTYNSYCPTALTAWERETFGWLEIDTLKTADDITLKTLDNGGKAFRVVNDASENACEYYILENIQNDGWNTYLYGHGMTVMHIDYRADRFSLGGCKVNSMYGHPRMTLIPADGMFVPETLRGDSIYADHQYIKNNAANQPLLDRYAEQMFTRELYKAEQAGDPFPGIAGTTQLTDESTPAAWVYYGDFMHKPITDIAEDEMQKTISFKFMGGTSGIHGTTYHPSSITHHPSPIYSLDGRFLGTDPSLLSKGLYIVGGKKILFHR